MLLRRTIRFTAIILLFSVAIISTPAAPAHPTTQVETSAARRDGSMVVFGSVLAIGKTSLIFYYFP